MSASARKTATKKQTKKANKAVANQEPEPKVTWWKGKDGVMAANHWRVLPVVGGVLVNFAWLGSFEQDELAGGDDIWIESTSSTFLPAPVFFDLVRSMRSVPLPDDNDLVLNPVADEEIAG